MNQDDWTFAVEPTEIVEEHPESDAVVIRSDGGLVNFVCEECSDVQRFGFDEECIISSVSCECGGTKHPEDAEVL